MEMDWAHLRTDIAAKRAGNCLLSMTAVPLLFLSIERACCGMCSYTLLQLYITHREATWPAASREEQLSLPVQHS